MDAELIAAASPPCGQCAFPVTRCEMTFERNGDGDWLPANVVLVCRSGHRVPVRPSWETENA